MQNFTVYFMFHFYVFLLLSFFLRTFGTLFLFGLLFPSALHLSLRDCACTGLFIFNSYGVFLLGKHAGCPYI
jgi:hypothetical protein